MKKRKEDRKEKIKQTVRQTVRYEDHQRESVRRQRTIQSLSKIKKIVLTTTAIEKTIYRSLKKV